MQMLTKKVQASITTIKERTGLYKIEKNKYLVSVCCCGSEFNLGVALWQQQLRTYILSTEARSIYKRRASVSARIVKQTPLIRRNVIEKYVSETKKVYVSSGSCFQRRKMVEAETFKTLNLTDSVLLKRCQNEKFS